MKISFNETDSELTNEQILQKLTDLSEKYASITISIVTFTDILRAVNYEDGTFLPVTEREILKSGLYGSFNGMKLMVSRAMESNYIEVGIV